jgi:acyl carrier protein
MLEKTEAGEAVVAQSTTDARQRLLAMIEEFAKMAPNSLTGAEQLIDLAQWDSLAALDFVLEVETQFGLQVSSEDFASCTTVEDLVNVVLAANSRRTS